MKYLLITVSLLCASQTMAQEKKKSESRTATPTKVELVSLEQDFMTADVNADGGISLAELEGMKENYEDFDVEKTFKLLDKDGNGIISSEEFQESTQSMRKRPGKVNVRR